MTILKYLFAAFFIIVIALGTLVSTGQIPDSKAVSGDELPSGVISELYEIGIVPNDEKIHYFYSEDIFSFVNYGNLFTDKTVIAYETDEISNERNVFSAKYNEITGIKFDKAPNSLDDSTIEIFVNGESSFSLLVSAEENSDDKFYQKLLITWEKNK